MNARPEKTPVYKRGRFFLVITYDAYLKRLYGL